MLHTKCGGRIKQQQTCPTCNEVLDRTTLVKGYEFSKDQYVRFTDDELKKLEGEASQSSTMRWQDYTQTAVDPVDDMTIWYVGDYLKKGASNYSTRIGGFRMSGSSK